jgi:hypothetical protein
MHHVQHVLEDLLQIVTPVILLNSIMKENVLIHAQITITETLTQELVKLVTILVTLVSVLKNLTVLPVQNHTITMQDGV